MNGYQVLDSVPLTVPREQLEKLRQYDAVDVGDTLYNSGTMFDIPALYPPVARVVGRAVTLSVTIPNIDMLRLALERVSAGDVLVINARGCTFQAMLGGNMAIALAHRGVAAVVVDGAVRDMPEMRDSGLPVFARGLTTNGAAASAPGEVNVPVACGGVVVNPGDIIIADEGGIVVVPPAALPRVLEKAETLVGVHEAQRENRSKGIIGGAPQARERAEAAGCEFLGATGASS